MACPCSPLPSRRAVIAVAGAAAPWRRRPAPGAGQQPTELESWRVPGWTITPGVVVGALFDSNVAIASRRRPIPHSTASDKLFQVEPFGQIDYFSPRTSSSTGYQGTCGATST